MSPIVSERRNYFECNGDINVDYSLNIVPLGEISEYGTVKETFLSLTEKSYRRDASLSSDKIKRLAVGREERTCCRIRYLKFRSDKLYGLRIRMVRQRWHRLRIYERLATDPYRELFSTPSTPSKLCYRCIYRYIIKRTLSTER